MRGAIPPLPQHAFMAWCSVKKTTGTTLSFTFTFLHIQIQILIFLKIKDIFYSMLINMVTILNLLVCQKIGSLCHVLLDKSVPLLGISANDIIKDFYITA